MGANKLYLEKELPHIASLLCSSMEELVSCSEVIVLTNGGKVYRQAPHLMSGEQILIDLVGTVKGDERMQANYQGICW